MNVNTIENALTNASESELRFPVKESLELIKAAFTPELLLTLTDRADIFDFILDNAEDSFDFELLDSALENVFWFNIHFC